MELESEFEVAKADTLAPAEAKVQQGQEEWNALMSKFENLKERKNQIIFLQIQMINSSTVFFCF